MQHNPYQAPIMTGPRTPRPGGVAGGVYEFDAVENDAIGKMGRRARWWGVICLVTGACGLLLLVGVLVLADQLAMKTKVEPRWFTVGVLALFPVVLTHLVIAFSYIGAGSSLLAVVKTEGNDVALLMQALKKLGTAFMVEFIVGALALVLGLAGGFAVAFYGPDNASTDSNTFDFDD